jgi:hypothetical protein
MCAQKEAAGMQSSTKAQNRTEQHNGQADGWIEEDLSKEVHAAMEKIKHAAAAADDAGSRDESKSGSNNESKSTDNKSNSSSDSDNDQEKKSVCSAPDVSVVSAVVACFRVTIMIHKKNLMQWYMLRATFPDSL